MTPSEWQRIQQIADTLLDLAPEARPAALAEACAGDHQLRERVSRIVASYSESDDLAGLTTATLPAPSRAGQMAGNYRLLRPLGEGGMGSVYLAERADQAFSKTVAVKLTSHASGQFVREREILARLEHAHIARLLDAGSTEDGSLFFVMEHVEGAQPMTEFARTLPMDQRLRLFVHACDGVHYAHQHGVIHCDLKPSNILVNFRGEVKVVDFGIAERDGSSTSGMASTDFASPEQMAGRATALSDVYSLGVTLRHLISSEPELQAITARATQSRPSARYESVAALAADVRAYRERRPVNAYRTGAAYYASKWAWRHPVHAIALVLAAGVIAAALAVAFRQQDRAAARTAVVREMARKLVLKDLPALQNQPNSTAVRATLMKEMEGALGLLESESAGDPELQIELAGAYHQTARLKAGDPDGSLAHYSAALLDLERAERLYRLAAQQRPTDVLLRANLIRSGLDRAYQLLKVGKLAEAGRVARGAEAEILALPAAFRAHPRMRRTFATTYHALGNIAVESGQLQAGTTYRKKGLAVYESELSGEPSAAWLDQDPWFRDHVSNLYAASASTASVYLGYAPSIEADARKALALLEPCRARPACATRIAETNTVLAKVLYSSGRRADAIELLRRNVGEIGQWWARDTSNGRLLEIEEESAFALVRCLLSVGSVPEAFTELARVRTVRRQLRQAEPENPRHQESESTLLLLEARALMASSRKEDAARKLDAALRVTRQVKEPTPQLAESTWAILEASAELAAPERAVVLREEALAVAAGLMRKGAERAAPLLAASSASYARAVLAAPTPARLAKAAGLIEKCRSGVVSDYPVMRGNIWVAPPTEEEVAGLLSRLRPA